MLRSRHSPLFWTVLQFNFLATRGGKLGWCSFYTRYASARKTVQAQWKVLKFWRIIKRGLNLFAHMFIFQLRLLTFRKWVDSDKLEKCMWNFCNICILVLLKQFWCNICLHHEFILINTSSMWDELIDFVKCSFTFFQTWMQKSWKRTHGRDYLIWLWLIIIIVYFTFILSSVILIHPIIW